MYVKKYSTKKEYFLFEDIYSIIFLCVNGIFIQNPIQYIVWDMNFGFYYIFIDIFTI